MQEVFPVAAGAILGAVVLPISGRWRLAALLVGAALIGLLASLISGELALSWGFPFVDFAQALIAAVLTAAVIPVLQRRVRRGSAGGADAGRAGKG